MKKQNLIVGQTKITFFTKKESDYISLTDIARYKNKNDPRFVIQNWMKTRYTVEFLGIWEIIHNPNFNRVEFDTVKSEVGTNTFVLTPQKWLKTTNAIGIISKSGRYGGGTFAHKDIAFEFASWISAEFKLYLIKEFQRLKASEQYLLQQDWDVKRFLVKANYRVHTDAVAQNLIPAQISTQQANLIYASEADVLNVAMFGMTAKQWREKNPEKKSNLRDYAEIIQLVCLAGLESLNAEFIRNGENQRKRLQKLNKIAIIQMSSLAGVKSPYLFRSNFEKTNQKA